jgi:HD-GYP domain-containing protein (c-di-GMP phosphodiesterase class II)
MRIARKSGLVAMARGKVAQALQPTAGRSDYIPVSSSMLVPSRMCKVALYVCDDVNEPYRLFRAPNIPITEEWLRKLEEAGRRKLYISTQDHQEFQLYLRENLKDVLQDETMEVAERFGTLNEVVRVVLGEAFSNGNLESIVAKSEELGHEVVELICREDAVASELCGVMYHDYHTFTHSANVAYYCVMLAKEAGITSPQELRDVAKGALLHDLGKLAIPEAILTKPGKLTDEEFSIIKMHPTIGFRKLCRRSDLSLAQLMMVYQHHERLDGTGYPARIGGSEIHPWARICGVADVFEALTSNRPYRAGMSMDAAFQIMDRMAGSGLDEEQYRLWKALMQKR